MKTITITTYESMPGRFRVLSSEFGKRPFGRDANGPGEAAAIAVEYALRGGSYVILGHKSALDQIPLEIRYKTHD